MNAIKLSFRLACVILAIYMTVLQSFRFHSNEDVSIIIFREFNDEPLDQYPTTTFCIDKFEPCNYGAFYDNEILNHSFGLNNCQFESFLKGEAESLGGADYNNAMRVNIENVSMKAENLFIYGHTINNKGVEVLKWKSKDLNGYDGYDQTIPILATYQTPNSICFSSKPSFEHGHIRSIDHFYLNQTYLNFYGHLTMRILTHLPGQVIRSLAKHRNFDKEISLRGTTHKYIRIFWAIIYQPCYQASHC